MADKEDIKHKIKAIYEALPKLDDGRCGYRTCGQFARAVAEGKAPCDGCITGGLPVATKVYDIMGVKIPDALHDSLAMFQENQRVNAIGAARMGSLMGRMRQGRGMRMGRGRGMGRGMGRGRRGRV